MSTVKIPQPAREAANETFWRVEDEHDLLIGDLCADFVGPILEAAAPLIVAAELERLAEDSDVRRGVVTGRALAEADEDPEESARLRRAANLHLAYARRLRARAAELRGTPNA